MKSSVYTCMPYQIGIRDVIWASVSSSLHVHRAEAKIEWMFRQNEPSEQGRCHCRHGAFQSTGAGHKQTDPKGLYVYASIQHGRAGYSGLDGRRR
jgi:hypothetical protein